MKLSVCAKLLWQLFLTPDEKKLICSIHALTQDDHMTQPHVIASDIVNGIKDHTISLPYQESHYSQIKTCTQNTCCHFSRLIKFMTFM